MLRPAGPWAHQQISANGARFHVAVSGDGPLVLLLHGFPTYWWTWRALMPVLAQEGYRAAAMDLRGYGGSDHPPRGYDPRSLSLDVVGVIRSLGAADAVVIGQGWGGLLAWTTAALHPDATRGIVPIAMAHPRRLRDAIISDRAQRRASSYAIGFQRPWLPERELVANGAAKIEDYLRDWSVDPAWPPAEVAHRYRQAFSTANTAHCALEYHRWALRSIPRNVGRQFITDVSDSLINTPVLQLHGAGDRTILPRTAIGSRAFTRGPYAWRLLSDVGHFPQEEAADEVASLITSWLGDGRQWNDPPHINALDPA